MGVLLILQLPAVLSASWLVEEDYIGRRATIIISGFLLTVSSIGCALGSDSVFVYVFASGILINACIVLFTLYPYTCEIYHTNARATALGFHNLLARGFSAAAPIAILSLA